MCKKAMSGKERVESMFAGDPVDRLPAAEDFWGDTIGKWTSEGHLTPEEPMTEHFDLDMDRGGLINWYADAVFGHELLEETEDTVLYLDGNGAKLKHHKKHASTPEHVDFRIKDRATWEEFAKPLLVQPDCRRIPFEAYRESRKKCREQGRYFMNDAFGPFELMQRAVGHEVLLLNMALDPHWIRDMVTTYADMNISHWDILFSREGLPQGTWIAEDLGFKFKPFMSPAMFEDLLIPSYIKMFDYLHSKGLKVIMHSCGFIEPLLPLLMDVGLDCYEAIEYKAGMDLPELFKKYGNRIVYFGNIDVRILESNDISGIREELEAKILPVIRHGGRYILHSDHSISPKVEYDTFRRYLEMGRSLAGQ